MKLQLNSPVIVSLAIVLMSFGPASALHRKAVDSHWNSGSARASSSAPFADSNFSMVFMSDPQFDWGCGSEENTTNDYCGVAANYKKKKSTQATETNEGHIAAIKAIKASTSDFAGVVISGDLTSVGSMDGHLSKFKKYYLKMGVTVWPGLGNHDYQNYVNDCGAKSWANYNYCSADMAQFLAGYVRDNDNVASYDVTRYAKNPAQAQGQRNVSGSLAYSWDKGRFHFVQLNNYPTYTKKFKRGYVSGISSWTIDMTSPADWLDADLKKLSGDKRIILAWHKYGDIYGDTTEDKKKLITMLSPYAGSIKAIFVGHFHWMYGQNDFLTFPATATRAAIKVPVIYSGSAIYSRFVKADFDTRTGCTITTTVINTSSGSPVPANNSNGGSGVYTIDCT